MIGVIKTVLSVYTIYLSLWTLLIEGTALVKLSVLYFFQDDPMNIESKLQDLDSMESRAKPGSEKYFQFNIQNDCLFEL